MGQAIARRTIIDENGDEHILIFPFVKRTASSRRGDEFRWAPDQDAEITTESGLRARYDKGQGTYWITLASGEEIRAKGDPPPKEPDGLP